MARWLDDLRLLARDDMEHFEHERAHAAAVEQAGPGAPLDVVVDLCCRNVREVTDDDIDRVLASLLGVSALSVVLAATVAAGVFKGLRLLVSR